MTDHPPHEKLHAFSAGILPPQELLSVGDHLARCERCAALSRSATLALASVEELRHAVLPMPDTEHLDDAALFGLMDDRLSVPVSLAQHLESCAACRRDLEDLRVFRASLLSAPRSTRRAPSVVSAPPGMSLRDRAAAWLSTVSRSLQARSPVLPSLCTGALTAGMAALLVIWVRPTGAPPNQSVFLQGQLRTAAVEKAQLQSQLAARDSTQQRLTAELSQARAAAAAARVQEQKLLADAKTSTSSTSSISPSNGQLTGQPAGKTPAARKPGGSATEPVVTAANRLEVPRDVLALQGRRGTLMGADPGTAVLRLAAPLGTAVRSARPAFSWNAIPNADTYQAVVYDANFAEVARSEKVKTTHWTPGHDLPRGATLRWEVSAFTADSETELAHAPKPPDPEARFRVLSTPEAAAIDRSTGETHLAQGLRYAHAGLLDEAEREFQAAADTATDGASASGTAARAAKLLAKVRGLRSHSTP